MWERPAIPSSLLADPQDLAPRALLEAWRWLVPEALEPLFISALGDMCLRSSEGHVVWLDVGAAELRNVAGSWSTFCSALADPALVQELFIPELVAALEESVGRLSAGYCYSFVIPPTLGGKYVPANFQRADLSSHFNGTGKVQVQVIDLPLGTEIRVVKAEGNEA